MDINLGNKKYKTILCDPPWPAKFVKLKMRPNQIEMPYKTMSVEDIKSMPIGDIADKNCNMFMWTTHTFLPQSLQVLKSWGFKYHCILTWDKTNGRPCWGFKRNTEFVIYGYRGRITVNQRGTFIKTIFTEKLTKHSKKPEVFYEILESNTPQPRIELFARNKRPGWCSWGHEV